MKKLKLTLLAMTVMFTASTFAQDNPVARRGLSLSIGPDAAFPVGTFRSESNYKFGIGGSAKLAIPFAANFDATVQAGYIAFSQSKLNGVTDKNTFSIIPFKGGIKYRTNPGFYIEPQAGFVQTKVSNMEGSGQFIYALNLGYLIARAVDLSVRYEAISAKDQTVSGVTVKGISAKMIGLRVAYNIPFGKSSE